MNRTIDRHRPELHRGRRALMMPRLLGDVVPVISRVALVSFSSAPQVLVAAQAGARVRVHQYQLTILGLDVVTFHSWDGVTPTAITGEISIDATRNKGQIYSSGWSPVGWFQTLVGQGLLFAPVLGTVTTGDFWCSYV